MTTARRDGPGPGTADGPPTATGGRRAAPSRRQVLLGGGVAALGASAAVALDTVLRRPGPTESDAASTGPDGRPVAPHDSLDVAGANGLQTLPFHGEHQAGVETPPQAHAVFLGWDLLPDTDRAALARMMRLLTDDAARLTAGDGALADTEPELAATPARLTVTFGFGPGLVARATGAPVGALDPVWLRPLPTFSVDRLRPEHGDGDLLVHVGSDDPTALAHAVRMLSKDLRHFAAPRWTQRGFRHAYGTHRQGVTIRNLFGQVDGTVNPSPGTPDFASVVWCDEGWLAGGTGLVLRRIAMDLDGWDELDRAARDQATGRTQANGAPLTGTEEFDEPDFEAVTELGLPVIPAHAHVRRARLGAPGLRMFRRGYNYEDTTHDGRSESGLLFAAYVADVDRQFVPVQRALDELDLLNVWTTPVGSSVFAIPPGCADGGYIGETLLA